MRGHFRRVAPEHFHFTIGLDVPAVMTDEDGTGACADERGCQFRRCGFDRGSDLVERGRFPCRAFCRIEFIDHGAGMRVRGRKAYVRHTRRFPDAIANKIH